MQLTICECDNPQHSIMIQRGFSATILLLLVGLAAACDNHQHHHHHEHDDHDHHRHGVEESTSLRGETPDFVSHRLLQDEPFVRNCGYVEPTENQELEYQSIIAAWTANHGDQILGGDPTNENGNQNGDGSSGGNGNQNGNANGLSNNGVGGGRGGNRGLRSLQVCTEFPVTIPVHFHVLREEGTGAGSLVPQGKLAVRCC